MSKYELRKFNNPALKVICRDVTPTDDLDELVDAMFRVMREHNGIGLAAPQVGSDLRVIIVGQTSSNAKTYTTMVNPRIIKQSEQTCFDREGCLSYPSVEAWVKRHKRVKIGYTNLSGCSEKHGLSGYHARVFQHEFDHLDGICRVGDAWRRQNPGMPQLAKEASV